MHYGALASEPDEHAREDWAEFVRRDVDDRNARQIGAGLS
jgi:hypothetical protein